MKLVKRMPSVCKAVICDLRMCGSHREARRRWYDGTICHSIWFALSGTIICFSNRTMTQNTPPGCVRAIWPRRRGMECCSDDLASTITWPQTNWDGLGWVGLQSEEKVANKCSEYVGTPSRLVKNNSMWSWLREWQKCAKLSSRQRVATLKNLIVYVFTISLQCRI